MMDIDNCPRCSQKWSSSHSNYCQCIPCQMWKLTASKEYVLSICNGSLYWVNDKNKCVFFSKSIKNSISLPYLPFTITPTQFKLYLTFQ